MLPEETIVEDRSVVLAALSQLYAQLSLLQIKAEEAGPPEVSAALLERKILLKGVFDGLFAESCVDWILSGTMQTLLASALEGVQAAFGLTEKPRLFLRACWDALARIDAAIAAVEEASAWL